MGKLIDEEKVKAVGDEVLRLCFERGMNVVEIGVMAETLSDAAVKATVMAAVLGDQMDDVVEAMMKMDAEKAIQEAEEALREGE